MAISQSQNNNYNQFFSKIFYINLDRRPDRDQNVKNILNRLGLNAERVSAVDGSKLNPNQISRDIITENGISDALNKKQKVYVPLTMGGIGCAMSHSLVWQKILDQKLDNALILEDDIRINNSFYQNLINMKNDWPDSYDVIFLGYHPPSIKYIYGNVNYTFVKSDKVFGLFGYIVSYKGAQKLLNIFPINEQIDTEIHKNFNKIDAYLVEPKKRVILSDPSEYAKEFGTDIQKRSDDKSNCPNIDLLIVIALIILLIVIIKL